VKNAADDNLLPRGGGAYLNEVDGNLTVNHDDGVVQLHWQGKFRGPDFAPVAFHLRPVTHDRLKDSKGRLIPTVIAEYMSDMAVDEFKKITVSNEDTILKLLSVDGRLSYTDIAVRSGWSMRDGKPNKSMAQRCVSRLKSAKLIRKTRAGYWTLTDAGEQELGDIK
jgi:hypothetical protein